MLDAKRFAAIKTYLLREVFLDSAKSVAQHLWIGLQVRDACAQQGCYKLVKLAWSGTVSNCPAVVNQMSRECNYMGFRVGFARCQRRY